MNDHHQRSAVSPERRLFADTIRAARKAKGLGQDDVAEVLEVKQPAVSAWESGRKYPTVDKLFALARLLGLSIDELIDPPEVEPEPGEPQAVAL
jgi:transcriptional regulator with XRE-family HTH domain